MLVKSFGCSFIFGSDLSDDGRNLPVPTPSNYTWPALLAKKLSAGYECHARPGSGNLQIAERILSHSVDAQDCFFIIGWTWIDRFDYTNSIISNDPIQAKWQNWRTIMPIDTSELAKIYYKGLHTEYRDKLTTLMHIKLVIDTLKQKKIPFLMTYMDELIFDQRWHTTPAVIDLQNYVRPKMTKFEDKTFLDWSRSHGYAESQTWHPLEDAHNAAADLMFRAFDKQNINVPAQLAHV